MLSTPIEDLGTLVLSKEAQEKLSEAVWRAVPENSLKIAQSLKPLSERVLGALEGMPLWELDKIAVSQDGTQAVIKLNTPTPSPEWTKIAGLLPKQDYTTPGYLQNTYNQDRSDWVILAHGIRPPKEASTGIPSTSVSNPSAGSYLPKNMPNEPIPTTNTMHTPHPLPSHVDVPKGNDVIVPLPEKDYSHVLTAMGEIGGYLPGGKYS